MRRNLVEKIRWAMLRTQRSPALASLYRKACQLVTWKVARELAGIHGVAAVFSRHTYPDSPTFVPGHSDIDITLVLADKAAEDPRWVRRCSDKLTALGRIYLFTKPQDARFISRSELCRLPKTFCSPWELLYRPEDWRLIGGQEVRTDDSLPFPPHRVPRHPEFNKWWENIFQTQFFSRSVELRRGFMRSLYRCAVKNQLTLLAATGIAVAKPDGFVSDELSDAHLSESPALQEILTSLKRRNFWAEQPKRLKAEIFLHVLKAAENFFANIQLERRAREGASFDAGTSDSRFHASEPAGEPHRSVYRAIQVRIENVPGVSRLLHSAIAYPLPHAYPYTYRLDLILREKLTGDDFVSGIEALERGLEGKNFSIANAPVEFTLIPKRIYQDPLFFLGSACPFLLEHIQNFGATVYGSFTGCSLGVWKRDDLLDWCRTYLPYHMFNFRRRLEHSSAVLNFCQLASIRIFLERDEKLTDPLQVRTRYFEEFATGDPAPAVLDALFHYQALRTDNPVYAEAFAYLSDTYDRLESLLGS